MIGMVGVTGVVTSDLLPSPLTHSIFFSQFILYIVLVYIMGGSDNGMNMMSIPFPIQLVFYSMSQ